MEIFCVVVCFGKFSCWGFFGSFVLEGGWFCVGYCDCFGVGKCVLVMGRWEGGCLGLGRRLVFLGFWLLDKGVLEVVVEVYFIFF